VDPDGREIFSFENPYLIFSGQNQKLQIWDDNNTPSDYSDDTFLGQYNAANNVSIKDNPAGKWEDGIYSMADTQKPRKHYDNQGNPLMEIRKGKQILVDSKYGAYGDDGIFCAQKFTQDDGTIRVGMGIHAGRGVTEQNVIYSFTLGCIRVAPETIEAIINAIDCFGPLTNIIVQNNRQSTRSTDANGIHPSANMPQYCLDEVKIIESK
jgi:hypothetical protein